MDVKAWKAKNKWKMLRHRVMHPPFLYRKAGGISAVVIRANGEREHLGRIADLYIARRGWAKMKGKRT